MNWLPKLATKRDTTFRVDVDNRTINVVCMRGATKALAERQRPLLMELELAFACVAHKRVRFYDRPPPPEAIIVNTQLALLITALVPDQCATGEDNSRAATPSVRRFLPRHVRVDCTNGNWVGEYAF